MTRKIFAATSAIMALFLCTNVLAHHAMEYIEMESYNTTKHGERLFHLHYDYMVDDSDNPNTDHWEFTPGLSYGITDRLMIDLHTHFAQFGQDLVVPEEITNYIDTGTSPFLEAAAVSLQYRATENRLIDVALSLTLEVPFSRAEKLLGSEDNVYAGTLILSRNFAAHGNVCLNLTYEEEGDEDGTTWALGIKNPISKDEHGVAAGVELMGDFDGDAWAVMPGIYAPLGDEGIVFKTGLQFGQEQNEDSGWTDTARMNVSFMYRF